MGGAQAMRRIPRIKFPQRHPTPSGSESLVQAQPLAGDASHTFFSGSRPQPPWEEKLLFNPNEHRCPKKRSRPFCWVAASDLVWSLKNRGACVGHCFEHF